MSSDRTFKPAAGRDIFLPLYDPLTRLFGFAGIQGALLRQAGLQPGFRALDVGCGTGTFAVTIKRENAAVDVVALDPDPKALARAQRKARLSDVSVQFDRGFADALPYDNAVFDRVFSSMMFHHLRRSEKEGTLREIHRVLKPGGRLEFIDFISSGSHGLLARMLHPPKYLADNADGHLVELMTRAGLSDAKRVGFRNTAFGHVGFYQASHAA
jgi:ubiquinone/menaquinone biosynthesis C-methylase UbiE